MLKKSWASRVSAFATHGVFPNNSHLNLALNIDKLYVTDSIPENLARKNDFKNMEVFGVFDLL